jgi:hypothetical protein
MTSSITCPQCGRTSHHPRDVAEQYCGNCHQWHDLMLLQELLKITGCGEARTGDHSNSQSRPQPHPDGPATPT